MKQTESPEYMDVDGFEGFFYETVERRIVEFQDFVCNQDNVNGSGFEVDRTAESSSDSELCGQDEEELFLLKEILNFKGKVPSLRYCCMNHGVEDNKARSFYFIIRDLIRAVFISSEHAMPL